MNTILTISVFIISLLPDIIIDVMNLINMIIPYSLIKISANCPPPYSILNPETISDSPSEKSKGVRLASAIHIVIHSIIIGQFTIIIHMFSCINGSIFILRDLLI